MLRNQMLHYLKNSKEQTYSIGLLNVQFDLLLPKTCVLKSPSLVPRLHHIIPFFQLGTIKRKTKKTKIPTS